MKEGYVVSCFKYFCVFFFLFLFATGISWAHPHVFMDCHLEIYWKGGKPDMCKVVWIFDKFFSNDIISAYDQDKNGIFDKQETQLVYNNAFINLKNYYYFTFIRNDGSTTSPASVFDFEASHSHGTMTYSFFVKLPPTSERKISIASYDYTYFCDIAYDKEQPVIFHCDESVQPQYTVYQDKNNPIYYNPLGAITDTRVYYEWQPGLQTYYPIEIVVTY